MSLEQTAGQFILIAGDDPTAPVQMQPSRSRPLRSDPVRSDQVRSNIEDVQPERLHRQGDEPANTASVRADGASVLQRLRRRRDALGKPLLTAIQVDAGERLAADFLRGQMMPRVTADWSAIGGTAPKRQGIPGYGVEVREGTSAAQERLRGALACVDPEFADLLINTCCFDIGLEAVEREFGWPKRAGKLMLQVALNQLARHYGLIPAVTAKSAIRHAAAFDYRPPLPTSGL
jgi:Domain of unknown function (DUF6456)